MSVRQGLGAIAMICLAWGSRPQEVFAQSAPLAQSFRQLQAARASTPVAVQSSVDGVSLRTREHGWVYYGRRDEEPARLREGGSDVNVAALVPVSPFGRAGNLVLSDEGEVRFQAYIDFVPWSEQLAGEVVAFGLVGEATAVGNSLAFFGDADGLRIRETLLGTEVARLVPDDPMTAADVSADRTMAVTATRHAISRWDIESGSVTDRIPLERSEEDAPTSVHLLAGGDRILVSSPLSGSVIYDLGGEDVRATTLSEAAVVGVAVSWDRTLALLRRSDSVVEVWDLVTESRIREISFPGELVNSVFEIAFEAPPEAFWSLSQSGLLERHAVREETVLEEIDATETFFWSSRVTLSPAGQTAHVVDSFADERFIYELETDRRFLVHYGRVYFLDEQRFVGINGSEVNLHRATDQGYPAVWTRNFGVPASVQISEEMIAVVVPREGQFLQHSLDPESGVTLETEVVQDSLLFNDDHEAPLPGPGGLGIRYQVIEEDASAERIEETVVAELWDGDTRSLVRAFPGVFSRVLTLTPILGGALHDFIGPNFVQGISWNQRYLAFGVGTKFRVWDLETGELRLEVEEPGLELDALVFGQDSRTLAASFRGSGSPGRLRVWRLTPDEEFTLFGLTYEGRIVVRIPDNRVEVDYVNGNVVNRVEVFDLEADASVEEVEGYWKLSHLGSPGGHFGAGLALGMGVVGQEIQGDTVSVTFQPEFREERSQYGWVRSLEGTLVGHFPLLPGAAERSIRDRGRVLFDADPVVAYVGIGSSIGAWNLATETQLFGFGLSPEELPLAKEDMLYLAEPVQLSTDRTKLLVAFLERPNALSPIDDLENRPAAFAVVNLETFAVSWMPNVIVRRSLWIQPDLERMVFSNASDGEELVVWNFVTESAEASLLISNRFEIGSTARLLVGGMFRGRLSETTLSADGSILATVDTDGIRFWALDSLTAQPQPSLGPELGLRRAGQGRLEVFWDADRTAVGAVLQSRESLTEGSWRDISGELSGVYVIDPTTERSQFFRWKP